MKVLLKYSDGREEETEIEDKGIPLFIKVTEGEQTIVFTRQRPFTRVEPIPYVQTSIDPDKLLLHLTLLGD